MSEALRETGFEVIALSDATRAEMVRALREFGDRLKVRGGVGLFYFAGHGMQIKGRNLLIPVGAEINREDEVEHQSLDMAAVLDKMETAGNGFNILILDACRNDPFTRRFRAWDRGLAQVDAPNGTVIAFATAPGSVAIDGAGEYGLYTLHLIRAMRQPGLKLEDVFKQVRRQVLNDSKGLQRPWESVSLTSDFYFLPPGTLSKQLDSPPAAPTQVLEAKRDDAVIALARPAPPSQRDDTAIALARPAPSATRRLSTGDTFRYQVTDRLRHRVTSTAARIIEVRASDGSSLDSMGTRRDADGRVVQEQVFGGLERFEPARVRFEHPLVVDQSFSGSYLQIAAKSVTWHFTAKVEREEAITVPAGNFHALKITANEWSADGARSAKRVVWSRSRPGHCGEGGGLRRGSVGRQPCTRA